MSDTGIKVAAAAALLVLTMIAGALPPALFNFFRKRRQSTIFEVSKSGKRRNRHATSGTMRATIQLLMYFGGGVLLATCFIHLMPEVRENFEKYNARKEHHHHNDSVVTMSNNSDPLYHDHKSPDEHTHEPHEHHGHDNHSHGENGEHLHTSESVDHTEASALHDVPHDHEGEEAGDHAGHSHSHGHNEHEGHSHDLPTVELAICGGFFVIYLLEELVHTFVGHHHHGDESDDAPDDITEGEECDPHHHHSRDTKSDREERTSASSSTSSTNTTSERVGVSSGERTRDNLKQRNLHQVISTSPATIILNGNKKIINRREEDAEDDDDEEGEVSSGVHNPKHHHTHPPHHHNNMHHGYVNHAIDLTSFKSDNEPLPLAHPPIFHTQSSDALVVPGSPDHQPFPLSSTPGSSYGTFQPFEKSLQPSSVRFVQGLVVIIAFSAHSIFDGVAIGIQEKERQMWTIFFAICSHKLVVAFAVGLELFEKTQSIWMTTFHMTAFSLMSPIGILIVVLTESNLKEDESMVLILLSAVASGTILYIVFFEILQRDRSKDKTKLTGLMLYLSMIVGFTAMVFITLKVVH